MAAVWHNHSEIALGSVARWTEQCCDCHCFGKSAAEAGVAAADGSCGSHFKCFYARTIRFLHITKQQTVVMSDGAAMVASGGHSGKSQGWVCMLLSSVWLILNKKQLHEVTTLLSAARFKMVAAK